MNTTDHNTITALLALFPPGSDLPYETRRDGWRLSCGRFHMDKYSAWVLSFRNGHTLRQEVAAAVPYWMPESGGSGEEMMPPPRWHVILGPPLEETKP